MLMSKFVAIGEVVMIIIWLDHKGSRVVVSQKGN